MKGLPRQRLEAAWRGARADLLAERTSEGRWEGELSSSALSTATAAIALAQVDPERHAPRIGEGLRWLAEQQGSDGGWGDTVRSRSNPSTTALAWAAFAAGGADGRYPETVQRAAAYLATTLGPGRDLVTAIESLYGTDRTFSVPITMTLALCGRLGPDGWSRVRSLPFELAALPRGLFGLLNLPVVSYALPALIAIGQVIHHKSGRWNPIRSLVRGQTLGVLGTLQPSNGGFLEATPLTSFVTMSLAAMGHTDHPVTRKGVEFLLQSVRSDGSWPIDTHLATWVTTLSVKALMEGASARDRTEFVGERVRAWLLAQQHRQVHPYTGATPGGWAWTPLPGGVPDADDTAGALLALEALGAEAPGVMDAAVLGVDWLLGLQNRDGGIPTFCRGWGALPFDRSTPELTAHALRAWSVWRSRLPAALARRVDEARRRALEYLVASQRANGSWIPLWFGNESAEGQENPVYGTGMVLRALGGSDDSVGRAVHAGRRFLLQSQNPDGGWGGALGTRSTLEETSIALSALVGEDETAEAVARGVEWLLPRVEKPVPDPPAPIGLYFARLWYFERLYPRIFVVEALGRLLSSS